MAKRYRYSIKSRRFLLRLKLKKSNKKAFTIIELLVSVVLISIVIAAILQMQQQTRDMAVYISDRSKSEFTNTLFTIDESEQYHNSEKDAYTIIAQSFRFNDFKNKEILEKKKKNIFVTDALKLVEIEDMPPIPFEVKKIMLKGNSSSIFYRFNQK